MWPLITEGMSAAIRLTIRVIRTLTEGIVDVLVVVNDLEDRDDEDDDVQDDYRPSRASQRRGAKEAHR